MKQHNYLIRFLAILCIGLAASCSDADPPEPGEPDPEPIVSPNVVFIIADDMGWDVFGDRPEYEGAKAHTPTIDSLARVGVTFHNFWTNPICAPTRAAMLTGRYAFRTGVGGVQTPQQATLQPSETIIQKYIRDQTSDTYASALIGKWHVSGSADLSAPEDFGVDYYSGIFLGAVPDYYDWTETSGGAQRTVNTYATTHLVDESISWIDEQSKPFFLWLALNAPHTPFHVPPLDLITDQTLIDSQAAIDADPIPYFLASIEAMDTEIKRLISSLTEEERANTVFIFMGDNGTPRSVGQVPFVGNTLKGTLNQGGISTPLIIAGKGVERKNVSESAMVQVQDMFATIADLTGAGSADYEDGISIKPLLSDANATKRSFAYSEQFGNTNTAKDGYAIRNENYKLIRLENGDEFLYRLQTDPFEKDDLLSGTLSAEDQQNLVQLREIKEGL